MKEKLKACYERLQKLGIQPTRGNMELLLQTLYDLQEVYNELEEMEHERTAADPERQPDD